MLMWCGYKCIKCVVDQLWRDLSIQGKLSSNSFDVVMVYMLYVKDHPGLISQAGRPKT